MRSFKKFELGLSFNFNIEKSIWFEMKSLKEVWSFSMFVFDLETFTRWKNAFDYFCLPSQLSTNFNAHHVHSFLQNSFISLILWPFTFSSLPFIQQRRNCKINISSTFSFTIFAHSKTTARWRDRIIPTKPFGKSRTKLLRETFWKQSKRCVGTAWWCGKGGDSA